jgi:light-regulated signal transduction histidine kinase (bacteriophytochrome)
MAATVTGDRISLCLLLESLIDEALSHRESGELKLRVTKDGQYIRFSFTDSRRTKSVDELNKLFTPELRRMAADGELIGTEYLVCKQIIRDHDEYAGRRGCRINAELAVEGGFTVYFTIPATSAASAAES